MSSRSYKFIKSRKRMERIQQPTTTSGAADCLELIRNATGADAGAGAGDGIENTDQESLEELITKIAFALANNRICAEREARIAARIDSNSTDESKKDPILHPKIVQTILSHLNFDDQLNCRLVCKTWKCEVDEHIKSRKAVKISHPAQIMYYIILIRAHEKTNDFRIVHCTIMNFDLETKNLQLIKLFEYLKPTLTSLRINNCHILPETFQKIMNLVGANLCLLNFTEPPTTTTGKLQSATYFPVISDGIEQKFPKVKILQVQSKSSSETNIKLSQLIEAFPNVVQLTAVDMQQENRNIFKKLRTPKLAKFTFSLVEPGILEQFHIDSILNLDLKLKTLELDMIGVSSKVTHGTFQKLMESQKLNLKHLVLTTSTGKATAKKIYYPSPFPTVFPFVKKLTIQFKYVKSLNNVLRSFPILFEIAFVFPYQCDWASVLPKSSSEIKPVDTVFSVLIDWIDIKSLGKFPLIFPYLRLLTLNYCNDVLLRTVFSEFGNTLRSFLVQGSDTEGSGITEEGLTGYVKAQLDKLDTKNPYGNKTKKRVWKNFRDMKELAYLELPYAESLPVTDKSIIFGIMKAPKLESFYLVGAEKVSSDVEEYVKKVRFDVTSEDAGSSFLHSRYYLPGTKILCFENVIRRRSDADVIDRHARLGFDL